MTALEIELNHLVNLMRPPFKDGWARYCWAKANAMASHADYAGLPAALASRMQSDSQAPGPHQSSINE